ncbi:trk system potassium uptake protein TrkA [Neolewinella xylanilytica]|uniref:Trk system potassium uptake protein TrkA n=1 Tax=Neolewinella xylanilytica TaxID=1514080 RepID=A0A2S6I4E3_9BACT|nr:TrkA family potassium uptake protein [Neolewinella xylanilytica]PPK86040.1 trk system potassium uptake protein TrkA [Neolewinella xylanilytica]
MKYIIVGLGNFGSSLGEKLTALGHEVIGIDNSMTKVDLYKEKLSHTIRIDAMDEITVSGLPLRDTDVVVIAIGENQGANIMATALFKNLQAKRLISRAINPLHQRVLEAIGVDEIVHPEEETAERWAKKLCMTNVVDSFELSEDFSIVEVKVPEELVGKRIGEIEFRNKFNLLVLTTIKRTEVKALLGKKRQEDTVQGVAGPNVLLEEGDIVVIFGAKRDLRRFTNE